MFMRRNEDFTNQFWRRFDVVLDERNLQIKDLCQNSGIPYKTLTGWRSKHRLPDLETAVYIAQALSCSLDSLMGVKESREPSVQDRVYEYMEQNFPTVLKDVLKNVEKKTGDSGTTKVG